jgi:hypothetical protein
MADAQSLLPLATEGVLRYVWEGRFGSMLIEVVGDRIFVNGERVEPANSGSLTSRLQTRSSTPA